MFESFKKYHTFMDHVNVLTKMVLGILLFFIVVFIHQFDLMIYLALMMLIFLLIISGVKIKLILSFVTLFTLFSLTSSLFMIFYGDGTHRLFDFGIIHITTESLVRGIHLSLRTLTVSFFGLAIAFTTEIVSIFYSLMQHLKVKPKYAYAFMAAIRIVPLMFESFFQLRNALKMRYQTIDRKEYSGFKRLKHLLIPLLSQNIRRAHRLSVAMEKKGFKDGPRTYYYNIPFSYRDLLLVVVFIALLGSAYLLAHYIPITGIMDVR